MKKIKLKLNGKNITCQPNQTIAQVAKDKGIFIPGLCQHDDYDNKANCRLCVVEVSGKSKLMTACSTNVEDGMEINTESTRVKKARNTNIELIFAEHIEKCATCIWRFECKLLSFAEKYKILITRFTDRKSKRKTYKFANAVEIDGSQCIDCRNCIDACSISQNIHYLELKGKGADQEVVPTSKKDIHCILCGQCAVHCPVSAAQEQAEWGDVDRMLKDVPGKKKKIMVAQFAPSIRVSIGEDFGLPHGRIVTEQIVASLRELGFDYVFDVNFGADITTMVEAEELLERVNNGGLLPMMTSCCPGWVNYVEFYHPELIPHFTTARSPHIHSGGAIKTFWASKMKIDPRDIQVVSIMPCTAKKYEASRPELRISNHNPVDNVLTTRELSFMLKRKHINLATIKKSKADNPLGEFSGAGAIYGASGGVMESALRTAQYMACGTNTKNCRTRLEWHPVRGLAGVKTAQASIAGKKLRIVVVNGIGNIEQVIEKLDDYDYIEVMACPGGCIGGGGQPIPTNDEIRAKRIAALYALDKKSNIRNAHENKGVKEFLGWLKKEGKEKEHSVLHTHFKKRINY